MSLTEIKNKHYEIEAIKMSNDCPIKNTDLPLPQEYNFFMLISGRPNSGKTTFWLNLITKKKKNTLYKKFDKVFIFTNSLKTITSQIKIPEEQIFQGLAFLDDVLHTIDETDDKTLIIIDDCMAEIKYTDDRITRLISNRRHIGGGCSIILTTQVFNKIPLSIRKMASDLIIFQTTNKKEISSIFEDYSSKSLDEFKKIIKHCFGTDNHHFLWIKTDTEDYYHNFNKIICQDDD